MLEEDRYCIDVIKQIQAVETALERVSEAILDSHLKTCVMTAVQSAEPAERERVLSGSPRSSAIPPGPERLL